MTEQSELRIRLGIIDALLFALGDPTVMALIDQSHDHEDAVERLQKLGLSAKEAEAVLKLPFGSKTISARLELQVESAALRRRFHQQTADDELKR